MWPYGHFQFNPIVELSSDLTISVPSNGQRQAVVFGKCSVSVQFFDFDFE